MSATRADWKRVEAWRSAETTPHVDDAAGFEAIYEEIFGPYFAKGLDIGRQVTEKLKARRKNPDADLPWPTFLQEEGLDSGLTAGFLNVCGICVIGEEEPFADLARVLDDRFGANITLERIETDEQLAAYPDYVTIPDEQQWSLPGVMIVYDTDQVTS